MTTYTITDMWSLGDYVGHVTDAATGRTRVAYRDACGVLRDCVVGEPLCSGCDEPADLCRCRIPDLPRVTTKVRKLDPNIWGKVA